MFAVQVAVGIGEKRGIKTSALVRGLPLTARDVAERKKPVSWDTYIEVVDRLRDHLGGNAELADAAAEHFPGITEKVTRFAALFVSPLRFVQFLVRVVDPRLRSCVTHRCEVLESGLVLCTHSIPEHYRSGESYFHAGIGAWRTVPCRLGLPEAKLVEVSITACRAEYLLELPAPRTIPARVRQAAVRAFAAYAEEELEADAAFIDENFVPRVGDAEQNALGRARTRWKLTGREAEVLLLLAEGQSNKEIARALGCSVRTAEVHVASLMRKSGTTARAQLVARFWRTEPSPPQER